MSAGSAVYRSNINLPEGDDEIPESHLKVSPIYATLDLNRGDGEPAKPTNPYLAPRLFWLDQYGSFQSVRFASHGYGSNFAYSVLDRGYRADMSRREAADLIWECFDQLSRRYVMSNHRPPRIKCVDVCGVTEIKSEIEKGGWKFASRV